MVIIAVLMFYYFFAAKYYSERPVRAFSLYLFFLIILPNQIGFEYIFDQRLWQFTALLFLLPPAIAIVLKDKIVFDKTDALVVSLVLLGSITVFIHESTRAGIGSIYKNFLYYFLPYFAAKNFIKDDEKFFKIINVINFSAIVVSVIAFYEFFSERHFLEGFPFVIASGDWGGSYLDYRFGQTRVAASLGHPIYLGVFILLAAIINVVLLVQQKPCRYPVNRHFFIVQIFQLILAPPVVLIAQSRTAVISFIVVILIFFFSQSNKIQIGKTARYMVTFSIILSSVLYFWFYDYLLDFIYYNVTSHFAIVNLEGRSEALFEGIRLIKQEINWLGESNRYFVSGWRILENTELSNGFINIITKTGMIYFILFSFLWFSSFYSLYRSRLYDTLLLTPLVFLLLYLFIVENLTSLNFQNMILFYVFTGFSLNRFLFKKKEVPNE